MAGGRQGRSLLPARILCGIGLGLAVVGAFFVSLATAVFGIILGMVGYFLGARVFGAVVVILSTAALFIGLLVGPAAVPGTYDEPMNGATRPSSGK